MSAMERGSAVDPQETVAKILRAHSKPGWWFAHDLTPSPSASWMGSDCTRNQTPTPLVAKGFATSPIGGTTHEQRRRRLPRESVRAEGLEPSSSLEHRHLKPARFPFRHARAHRDPTGSSGDEMSVMPPNLAS